MGAKPEVKTILAACPHDCPDTCSMVITTQGGKAINLRGNADHAFTDGFLCAKVNRYLERVYHADRLLHPLRRTGPKGSGQFTRISWDEALTEICGRFKAIAASPHGPQAVLPYSYAGTMGKLQYASLDRRFFHRLGASLLDRTICATAGGIGSDLTLGTRAWVDPESVMHSKLILNWGSNTSVTNMHLWSNMHRARKAGAKIVTIDPHRSRTAARSDQWLAIRPGTDAALALGMMHIIFRDGLEDRQFLEQHCLGAAELRERALADYSPAKVAAITCLSEQEIETLAHEYATRRPAFIRLNYGLQRHRGGGMAVRTVTCLPAIIGSWKERGGGAMLSTSAAYKLATHRLERPDLIRPGTRTINMVQLAEALNGELPGPPVEALYVYNSNPANVCPDQRRVLDGLRRDDLFTVVHDLFLTDTARFADIVLPATSQLEHFDIHNSYGHLYMQVNQPAITPLGECKPNTEVFRLLGRGMGFEPELFAKTDEELAEELLGEDSQNPESPLYGITVERLKKAGPLRLNLPEDVLPFADGRFPTASGKCELYSPQLARQGREPLPIYTPPAEDPQTRPDLATKYPLQLITPPHPMFLNSSFVNVASLRHHAGLPTIEIHPQDATPRGIQTGDDVDVVNDRGRYRAYAAVGETVAVGTAVALGLWWSQFTKDGLNCNAVTSTTLTDYGGGATFFDNLVEVRRAVTN